MITSVKNEQVKRLVQLRKSSAARNREGVFLAEGKRLFEEIPEADLETVYVSETFLAKEKPRLPRNTAVEILTDKVFAHAADTETPQGILAVARQRQASLDALLNIKDPNFLILENLQDPGNLGTIFRTGEGAGITGIILNRGCVDVYNPKVVRGSMGSILRVPFAVVDSLTDTLAELKKSGVRSFAAYLDGSRRYYEESYLGGVAFLIGNEGNGLSRETAEAADVRIRIPMRGKVESLNAAIAVSILEYEAFRQRERAGESN